MSLVSILSIFTKSTFPLCCSISPTYSGNAEDDVYIFPWILLGIVIVMIIIMAIVVFCLLYRRRKGRDVASDPTIEMEPKSPGKLNAPGVGQMESMNIYQSSSTVFGDVEGHGEQVEGQEHANETTSPVDE